jgi:D-threo-aldose 1-dehydrogenase
MKRVQIGKSGLEVTQLGLGTAPLGGLFAEVGDADAEATIAQAWSLGVRMFDTAPLYGFGLAEQRLGGFLRAQPRDSYVLSTKVGRLLRADQAAPAEDDHYKGAPRVRPHFDYSYDGVMRSVDESLERLGLDRIDILLVHDPDDHYDTAVGGAFRALQRLRDDRTIRAIGAGMNQSEMLARFAEAVPVDCFLLAGRYTLLDQGALTTLFPICRERNVDIMASTTAASWPILSAPPSSTTRMPAPRWSHAPRSSTRCASSTAPNSRRPRSSSPSPTLR